MPLYDVKCPKCQIIKEIQKGINDPYPLCKCGEQTERVYTTTPDAYFFASDYFYDGMFHRHPKVIGEQQFHRSHRFHGIGNGKN